MNPIDLKPCPFCGANSENLRIDTMYFDEEGEQIGVECLQCDALARVEWWNERDD
jgi:hypothetical protein